MLRRAALASIAAAALLASCGEAEPQSKAEFIDKADQICESLVVEQRRALNELGAAYTGTTGELRDALDGYRDVIAVRLERIKDLGKPKEPPRTYIATLRHYVHQLETVPIPEEDDLPADPVPVRRILGEERPRLLREVEAYGIEACLKLDEKPLPQVERLVPPREGGEARAGGGDDAESKKGKEATP